MLAWAIQFLAAGIPQVYYVGLLAGANDIKLLEETKQGRDINRHYYSKEEIDENMKRPVVKKLVELMKFRNQHPAFNGSCTTQSEGDNVLVITREYNDSKAVLRANLSTYEFSIDSTEI